MWMGARVLFVLQEFILMEHRWLTFYEVHYILSSFSIYFWRWASNSSTLMALIMTYLSTDILQKVRNVYNRYYYMINNNFWKSNDKEPCHLRVSRGIWNFLKIQTENPSRYKSINPPSKGTALRMTSYVLLKFFGWQIKVTNLSTIYRLYFYLWK